ncbi:hypothetical protein KXR83_26475 [Williamsia muralis]|uniref:hypothetical protein n=1 Tax=Williamsia marianensis TaxID=85044 RepID=UPI003F1523BC
MADAISTGNLRPGMPAVSDSDLKRLVDACARLNQCAFDSNRLAAVAAGSIRALIEVVALAENLAADSSSFVLSSGGPRTELVNVRVSDSEVQQWSESASRVGFERVSAWARDVVLGVAGYVSDRRATDSVMDARRQLSGAINNAAQLHAWALDTDVRMAYRIESLSIDLVNAMAAWSMLGRPR